jgi:hypothetical protein
LCVFPKDITLNFKNLKYPIMTFSEAVKCYRCLLCKRHLDELENVMNLYKAYKASPTPATLHDLSKACVIGPHQHRILRSSKSTTISVIESHLLTILATKFTNFEDLRYSVNSIIGSIPQVGPLTVYDVSLRIGHLFNTPIYPRKYLYLNSGAMEGAKILLNGRKLSPTEELTTFFSYPEALAVTGIGDLQALPNNLIEDFFCVMKDYLAPGPRGLIPDRDKTSTYLGM